MHKKLKIMLNGDVIVECMQFTKLKNHFEDNGKA